MVDSNPESNPDSSELTPNASAEILPTRRSLRPLAHARVVSRPHEPVRASVVPESIATPKPKKKARRTARSMAIMALVVPGLLATVALPAYAAFTPSGDSAQLGSSTLQNLKTSGAQSISVKGDVEAEKVTRDGYTATTSAELASARAAEEAAAARAAAVEQAAAAAENNVSATELVSNPTYQAPVGGTGYQSELFNVALQYQGVPYVFGGATPAGFDCSGFVKYVYAQFGMSLPHSSTAQGNMGTVIPLSEAVPGDLLVKPGHIGFYAGNGQILHASQPGVPLRIGPMYGNYQAVRLPVG